MRTIIKISGALGVTCLAMAGVTAPVDAMMKQKQPAADIASAGTPLPEKTKEFPVGTIWVLKMFNDKPIPVSEDLTFSIDKTYRGSGYSGCNMWSATVYPVKDQKFLVGPVAVTKKQCDKTTTQFELTYLTALHQGPSWSMVGGNLVLKGQAGTLVFERTL